MKRTARILAILFGAALLGATITNAALIGDSRRALSETVLRDTQGGHVSRYLVMVVLPDTDDSFFQGLREGINSQAPMVDAAIQVFRYSESIPGEANHLFEIAQKAKVDGLIMYCPSDSDPQVLVAESRKHGVAFVPVGTDPPIKSSQGFIGSGSLLQGLRSGNLIGAKLGNTARVGLILPESGDQPATENALYRGVATAMRAFPGSRIIKPVKARHGILSGEEATATLLLNAQAVNAIVCSNAQDTEGAAQVIVDMNLVGRVMIIGTDETPEIRRFIEKNVISASIVRDSRRIGQEAIRAFAMIKAGQAAKEAVEVGFLVRTSKGLLQ